MKTLSLFCQFIAITAFLALAGCTQKTTNGKWSVNKQQYLEKPGLSVLAFHDYYPGGKQGGIEIIQHGERIATNGFIRMQDEGRGMVSGTALIRPDFPELKEPYPYLWQQTEYVMSGVATYIFCVKAADKLLNM